MREGFLHEMSKDEQLKANRGGGRVVVGEWSGALNPCDRAIARTQFCSMLTPLKTT